ncbi:hypothetical protein ACJX0J_024909, partial [Zea mays]
IMHLFEQAKGLIVLASYSHLGLAWPCIWSLDELSESAWPEQMQAADCGVRVLYCLEFLLELLIGVTSECISGFIFTFTVDIGYLSLIISTSQIWFLIFTFET